MQHFPQTTQQFSSGAAHERGAEGEKENGSDSEEPRPNAFLPFPEPFPKSVPEPSEGAAALPALLAADYRAALRGRVRSSGLSAHVQHLDLSGVAMDAAQWRWLSRDVLPSMPSVSTLRFARMGLTDRSLAELTRGCRIGHPTGAPASSSSPSALRSASGGSTSDSQRMDEQRATLRGLRVLDLSGNHFTHRSATAVGKLLLWAADTLDELHLSGNPLQDYGFQVLGIYLSKLQIAALGKERHLFPPGLVRQYAELQQRSKQYRKESRLQPNVNKGSSSAPVRRRTSHKSGMSSDTQIDAELRAIHLGIALLDVRACRASVRGISELLAGASRAHRLKTIHFAQNGVIPRSLTSLDVSSDTFVASAAVDVDDEEIDGGSGSPSSSTAGDTSRFSKFEELHYPSALVAVNLCGVPLSKVCRPIGCRELFLNLFFCCPNLQLLDVSESFDRQQVSPTVLQQLLVANRNLTNNSQVKWRMQREKEGAVEFTLDGVYIGRQAFVGGVLCELIAHAAFNAQLRRQVPPLAFTQLRELYINGTGMTDRAANGLEVAVRSVAVTGILSSLVVLNAADNLLTVHGCTCLLKAFVLEWPLFPSVLSALALHGNAGINRNDITALRTLHHTCESAVLRRREEQQQCLQPQSKSSPLPLRIHFGAFEADTMCVSSDGSVGPVTEHPQQLRAVDPVNDTERGEEYFPTFHLRPETSDASCMPLAAGSARPLFAEVPASASFAPDGSLTSHPSYATNATGTAFDNARAVKDMSSIHACETPRRLFGSTMATMITPPSFFEQQHPCQRSPISEKGENAFTETRRGKSTPLISPSPVKRATVQEQSAEQKDYPPVVEANPQSDTVYSTSQPVASLSALSREADGAWAAAVASARAKNNATEGGTLLTLQTQMTTPSSTVPTPQLPPPHPPVPSLQKPSQHQQTAYTFPVTENHALKFPSPSSSSAPQASTPSMAFSIGCLFASMDMRRSKAETGIGTASTVTADDRVAKEAKSPIAMPPHDSPPVDQRLEVSTAERLLSVRNDHTWGQSPNSEPILEGLEESHDPDKDGKENIDLHKGKASTRLSSRNAYSSPNGNGPPGSAISPLLSEDEEGYMSFASMLDTSESAIGERRGQEGVTSEVAHKYTKRFLSSCFENLDSLDVPLSVSTKVTATVMDNGNQADIVNLNGNGDHTGDKVFTGMGVGIEKTSSALVKKSREKDIDNLSTRVEKSDSNEPQQLSHCNFNNNNPTVRAIDNFKTDRASRPRCVKTFVLTYHHPVGHLLCSGWRILSCKGTEGANARARFEEDVRALVYPPPELQQDGAVLSSVTVVMPFMDDALEDFSNAVDSVQLCDGSVRIQFTSNERRAVLAERLQRNANVYDERTAFPRFAEALDQAFDTPFGDVIQIVESLLLAAEANGVSLPPSYSGKATATIVHESHGGEDALINELRALLSLRAERTAPPGVICTPERKPKETLTETSREEGVETDGKLNCTKVTTSSTKSTKDGESKSAEKRLRDAKSPGVEIPVTDKNQSMSESAVSAEMALTRIESSPVAVSVENEDGLAGLPCSSSVQQHQQPPPPQQQQSVDVLKPTGRVRTFVLSLPHTEGHLLCRAWSLLHRRDAIGDEARALFKEDLHTVLQLPVAGSSREGVEFTCEGVSATMQLRVTTSERRVVVSKRLQYDCNGEPVKFPRLAEMFSFESGKRHDTIRGVEAFLSSQAVQPALRDRIARRYRNAAALVHYYHTDTAALLHELGAASLAAVEDAVDLQDCLGGEDTQGEKSEMDEGAKKKHKGEEIKKEDEEEEEEEGGGGEKDEGLNCVTFMPSSPMNHADLVDSQAAISPVSPSPLRDEGIALPDSPEEAQRGSKSTFRDPQGAMQPSEYAFEERMRRLQYLAYDAVRYGAILLDVQQRHKQRICKGKCGRQHVTVAVEWDFFLVIYFVRRSVFGTTAKKALVLVHPIPVGVQCFVPEDNPRDIVIHIERACGPDELGVSSGEMERKLHQQLRIGSGGRNGTNSRTNSASRNVTPLPSPMGNFTGEHMSNTSAGSNFSLATNNSLATGSLPDALQLMAMNVSLRLTLGSAEKAQETAIAIETAGLRATTMIRRNIRNQLEHK